MTRRLSLLTTTICAFLLPLGANAACLKWEAPEYNTDGSRIKKIVAYEVRMLGGHTVARLDSKTREYTVPSNSPDCYYVVAIAPKKVESEPSSIVCVGASETYTS